VFRINSTKSQTVRFFAALLMNKAVVRGVAWMERSGIREVGAENPGFHPGYCSVHARLDERAPRYGVLRMTLRLVQVI
jgi:hypothetical protein